MNGHAVLRKQACLPACRPGRGPGWRVKMPCTAVGTLTQEPQQGQCVEKVAPNGNCHQNESKGYAVC